MNDDLVKMCKRLSKHAHAQLSSTDLESIANRIEQLEAQLQKQSTLMDMGFAEYERRLAAAVKLIELAVKLARWDLNPTMRDQLTDFATELKGKADE